MTSEADTTLGTLEVLLFAVGFFVALRVVMLAYAALQLRRIKVKRMAARVCHPSDIPVTHQSLLRPGVAFLERAGFQFSHCEENDGMYDEGLPVTQWALMFFHPTQQTWARLSNPDVPERFRPFAAEFQTELANGLRLITVDGLEHTMPGEMPNTVLRDAHACSIEQQWQAHLDLLGKEARGARKAKATPEHSVRESIDTVTRTIEDWEKSGIVVSRAEGGWQLSWKAAFGLGRAIMKATAQRRKAANKGDLPRNHQVIPPALLATTFQRVQSYRSKPLLSWPAKLALLIGSMVAFALSFSFRMDWFTVVAFLIALVIHEAGHLLGMRLFRYKNLQVLFLPFLGAAAIGQNDDVPTHRRVIVYLLGPLPGIMIGLVLMASTRFVASEHIADLLFELSVVFLALNLINLLPIMPLDGGHVVNDLAFAKMPRIRAAFQILGALALFAAGVGFGDTILVVVAPVLLLGVGKTITEGRMAAELRAEPTPEPEDPHQQLVRIFESIDGSKYAELPFASKFEIAKRLIRMVQAPRIEPLERGLLAGFYTGAIVMSPLAVLLAAAFAQM